MLTRRYFTERLLTYVCQTLQNKVSFGWAEADITSKKKVALAGQFAERISEYVEKPLYATALTLKSENPCVDDNDKTAAVTIASASIGGSEELELFIRNPAGDKISVMGTEERSIEPLSVTQTENGVNVVLPGLIPYEIITVFAEK